MRGVPESADTKAYLYRVLRSELGHLCDGCCTAALTQETDCRRQYRSPRNPLPLGFQIDMRKRECKPGIAKGLPGLSRLGPDAEYDRDAARRRAGGAG